MRYLQQHIQTIIDTYTGSVPLTHFLKNHFRQHPKLGSRDRKILSAMAYSWYRCSKGINEELRNGLTTQWIEDSALIVKEPLENWLAGKDIPVAIDALFPFDSELSEGISKADWLRSMLTQPDLFIRIRKDKQLIEQLLNQAAIPFTYITDTCMALPNGAKIDTLLPADSYVVQDASSQQTGHYFDPQPKEQWYDCCSGAGGKSLLLKDLAPSVHLTVSDKRDTILHNLKQRFRLCHITTPDAVVTDAANKEQLHKALGNKRFDNIICDAPCSGSGTWARTPEQLYFYDPATTAKYAALQQAIAINAAQYLKDGGRLIYITCSVFKQENEAVVAAIVSATGLEVVQQQLINGISIKADSMFIAVLHKKTSFGKG